MTDTTHPFTIDLTTDVRLALRRFASDADVDLKEAAQIALRDWLIANSYLELAEADNDND